MKTELTIEHLKLSFSDRFDFWWLIFPVLTVLVFSFNFHAFWLIYDLVALPLFFYFILSRLTRVSVIQKCVLAVVLGYFVTSAVLSDHVLFSVLSIWDTFKHLIYLTFIFSVLKFGSPARVDKFAHVLYKTIFVFFLLQTVAVLIQYQSGEFFDDIAGTFGDGGSHAIGYFSVLFIIGLIVQGKGPLALFIGIALSLLINLLSENAGYYVLLPLVMAGIYFPQLSVKKIIKPKSVIFFSILFVLVYLMSGVAMYSEKSFRQVAVERLVDVVATKAEIDGSGPGGRGKSMKLATELGGWFGQGLGAYSDIYQMEGYYSSSLAGQQINISEATHLNAESGRVGYVLTIVIYTIFLFRLFEGKIYKLVSSVLFIVCTYYTAVLMNESHFFIFLLLMFFFAVHEKRLLLGKNIKFEHRSDNVEA